MNNISLMTIDQSLTDSGICIIKTYNRIKKIYFYNIECSIPKKENLQRLNFIWLSILNLVHKHKIKDIIYEGYAFSRFNKSASITGLSELVGGIKQIAFDHSISIKQITTTHACKELTGKGKYKNSEAKKKAILEIALGKIRDLLDFGWEINNLQLIEQQQNTNVSDAFAIAYSSFDDKKILESY